MIASLRPDHEFDLVSNLRLQTLSGIDASGLNQLVGKIGPVRLSERNAALLNH